MSVFSFIYSQGNLKEENVSFDRSELTLEHFLDQITAQTGILFSYSSQQINSKKQLKLEGGTFKMREILIMLNDHHNIDYLIVSAKQNYLKGIGKESTKHRKESQDLSMDLILLEIL